MPFDHHEFFCRLWSNLKIKSCSYAFELEKDRAKVILDCPCLLLQRFSPIFLLFFNFKKSLSSKILLMYISDFEIHEFYLIRIGISRTEISISGCLKVSDFFNRYVGVHFDSLNWIKINNLQIGRFSSFIKNWFIKAC